MHNVCQVANWVPKSWDYSRWICDWKEPRGSEGSRTFFDQWRYRSCGEKEGRLCCPPGGLWCSYHHFKLKDSRIVRDCQLNLSVMNKWKSMSEIGSEHISQLWTFQKKKNANVLLSCNSAQNYGNCFCTNFRPLWEVWHPEPLIWWSTHLQYKLTHSVSGFWFVL